MSAETLTGTHLGILGVSLLGFFSLALATERHAEHLLGRLPKPHWRHLARTVGWLLLALSLGWAMAALDIGVGITLWLGWLTVAALAWVFTFPQWPWQPAVHEKAPRASKVDLLAGAMPPTPRLRRSVAAALLATTAVVFTVALMQVELQPLKRPRALHGQIGSWSFTLAEAHQEAPELMEMDIPMKEYRLRFCEACDADIRHVYLKVNRPRSERAVGMGFMGQRWERRVEIPLPSTTNADSELWLTVVGKDGAMHQTHWRMDQASPATVAWFEKQRRSHGSN
jgi:Protein of unknown function (DUF3325)